jgi:hypothetical protein
VELNLVLCNDSLWVVHDPNVLAEVGGLVQVQPLHASPGDMLCDTASRGMAWCLEVQEALEQQRKQALTTKGGVFKQTGAA